MYNSISLVLFITSLFSGNQVFAKEPSNSNHYHSGEVRWENTRPFSFKKVKKKNSYFQIKPNNEYYIALPKNSILRIQTDQSNFPLILKRNSSLFYEGNSSGGFKKITLKANKRQNEFFLKSDPFQLRLIRLYYKEKNVDSLKMNFLVSKIKPLSSGEAFRLKELSEPLNTSLHESFTRDYTTKDSEKFYALAGNNKVTFKNNSKLVRFDFKMPLDYQSKKTVYRNWILVHTDKKFHSIIKFDQPTAMNQLNYIKNSPITMTKTLTRWFQGDFKEITFKPLLPIFIRKSSSEHRYLMYEYNNFDLDHVTLPFRQQNFIDRIKESAKEQQPAQTSSTSIIPFLQTNISPNFKTPYEETYNLLKNQYGAYQSIYPYRSKLSDTKNLRFSLPATNLPNLQDQQTLFLSRYAESFNMPQNVFVGKTDKLLQRFNFSESNSKKIARLIYFRTDNEEEKISVFSGDYKESFLFRNNNLEIPLKKLMSNKGAALNYQAERFYINKLSYLSGETTIRLNSNIKNISYIDFEIPEGTNELNIKTNRPLYLGLQILNTKLSHLDSKDLISTRKFRENSLAEFKDFILKKRYTNNYDSLPLIKDTTLRGSLKTNLSKNYLYLYNHLAYYYEIQKNQLGASFDPNLSKRQSQVLHKSLSKAFKPLEKLAIYSKLCLSKDKSTREDAILNKANLLLELQETGVFERFVKKQLLSLNSKAIESSLLTKLYQYYKVNERPTDMLLTISSQVFLNPSYKNINLLIEVLNESGKYQLARSFSTILMDDKVSSNMLEASIRSKDLELFKYFSNNYKITKIQNKLKKWIDFNFNYSTKDKSSYTSIKVLKSIKNNPFSVKDLTNWLNIYKPTKGGSFVLNKIENNNFNGSDLISARTGLNEKIILQKSRPDHKVSFKLLGPKVYKLDLRLTHNKTRQISPLNDWITFKANNTSKVQWPIIENLPSKTIRLEDKDIDAGDSTSIVIDVPPGIHLIEVKSQKNDFIVSLAEMINRDQLPIIPLLNLNLIESLESIAQTQTCSEMSPGENTFIGSTKGSFSKFRKIKQPRGYFFCSNKKMQTLKGKILKGLKEIKGTSSTKFIPYKMYSKTHLSSKLGVIYKIHNFLYQYEKTKDIKYIIKLEHLYQKQTKELKQILSSAWLASRKYAEWSKFENIIKNDGIWIDDNPNTQYESYNGELTAALSGVTNENTKILKPGYLVSYKLKNSALKRFNVQVHLQEPTEKKIAPVKIELGFKNSNIKKIISLTQKNAQKSISFKTNSTEELFYAKLIDGARGQTVTININVPESDGSYRHLDIKNERTYHISSYKNSIEINIKGPSLIRYNYLKKPLQPRFIFLASGDNKIIVPPIAGEKKSFVRFSSFQSKNFIDYKDRPLQKVKNLKANQKNIKKIKALDPKFTLIENLDLNYQNFGTFTSYTTYKSRILSEEPLGGFIENENFVEVGATIRKSITNRPLYLKSSLFSRYRQFGQPSFGLINRATGKWQPFISTPPLSYWFTNRNFYQNFSERGNKRAYWATQNSFSLAQHRQLAPYLTHYPQIDVFHRHQNQDSLDAIDRIYVDQDVFTSYKEQHRWGVSISNQLTWQPFWNSFLKFKGKYVTNEELTDPEYLRFQVTWAHLLNSNFEFSFNYSNTLFLDSDISTPNISWLKTQIMFNKWLVNQNRLETQFGLSWNPEFNRRSFSLSLRYHFGRGRAYTDFYPGERNFKGLKQRHAPKYNLINYDK